MVSKLNIVFHRSNRDSRLSPVATGGPHSPGFIWVRAPILRVGDGNFGYKYRCLDCSAIMYWGEVLRHTSLCNGEYLPIILDARI